MVACSFFLNLSLVTCPKLKPYLVNWSLLKLAELAFCRANSQWDIISQLYPSLRFVARAFSTNLHVCHTQVTTGQFSQLTRIVLGNPVLDLKISLFTFRFELCETGSLYVAMAIFLSQLTGCNYRQAAACLAWLLLLRWDERQSCIMGLIPNWNGMSAFPRTC